jgi:hypothetical protein
MQLIANMRYAKDQNQACDFNVNPGSNRIGNARSERKEPRFERE